MNHPSKAPINEALSNEYLIHGSLGGENLLAFEILELKACCNKGRATELDDFLFAAGSDYPAPVTDSASPAMGY